MKKVDNKTKLVQTNTVLNTKHIEKILNYQKTLKYFVSFMSEQ